MCFVLLFFVEFRFTLLNILSCFFIYFNFIYRSRAALNVFSLHTKSTFLRRFSYSTVSQLTFSYFSGLNFVLGFLFLRISLSLFTLKYETSGLSTKVTHQVLLLCIFINFSYFFFTFCSLNNLVEGRQPDPEEGIQRRSSLLDFLKKKRKMLDLLLLCFSFIVQFVVVALKQIVLIFFFLLFYLLAVLGFILLLLLLVFPLS